MPKNWILWGIVILAAVWFFHVHVNRKVPVKKP